MRSPLSRPRAAPQAIDTKVLRKPASRGMAAISGRDKTRRDAAGTLMARNRAVLLSLTHQVAGLPSPVDVDSYTFSAEQQSILTGARRGGPPWVMWSTWTAWRRPASSTTPRPATA